MRLALACWRAFSSHKSGGVLGARQPQHLPTATAAILAAAAAALYSAHSDLGAADCQQSEPDCEEHEFVNWSATHKVRPRQLYQPESLEELEDTISRCHESGQQIRVVGSGLSPNGMAFSSRGMLSTALLDKVIAVDTQKQQVTVQAGARVDQVMEALRPHGLTLQNFASIREQSLGGFSQAGCHGSGARIPPVDEQVVALKLVTPARGCLELSAEKDPDLFYMARVGLGCLGVVAELTLQCVPAHQLLQRTQVLTRRQVHAQHRHLLRQNRHLRYMWLPYTDAVVVVTCNPHQEGEAVPHSPAQKPEAEQAQPFRSLLGTLCGKLRQGVSPEEDLPQHMQQATQEMAGTELRDHLLAIDPLDPLWVARVNQAEAEYWRSKEGYERGWSDWLLGFDCGGQQWVLETAFACGTVDEPNGADLAYMEDLLKEIEAHKIPAPSPIEQRWTSGSKSMMSPASAAAAGAAAADSTAATPSGNTPGVLFSWVGIIMYMPNDDSKSRAAITKRFKAYVNICKAKLFPKYSAVEHWAKIEPAELNSSELRQLQQRIANRYPVEEFNRVRKQLDPKQILHNEWLDAVLPCPP